MTTKPLKVLVCLIVLSIMAIASISWGYNGGLPGGTGIQGDALSADPSIQITPPVRSGDSASVLQRSPSSTSRRQYPVLHSSPTHTGSSGSGVRYRTTYGTNPNFVPYQRPDITSNAAMAYPAQPPGPYSAAPGMFGPFAPGGLSIGYSPFLPILPRIKPKQFQIEGRVWYARINSSTVQWGAIPGTWGIPGSEVDLTKELGLAKNDYTWEVAGRCQLRCNWGIRYSFMPIHRKENYFNTRPFWFGNWPWPAGIGIVTEWDRNIHSWELIYDWFQGPHAVASIFGGYRYVDDKLKVSSPPLGPPWSKARSRTINLAQAGASIDRVISRVGGCAVASMHCKGSVQFLEDYVGWDLQAMGRISVPMCQGRYGYLEGGWKWMDLERSYKCDIDKVSLEGFIASAGLIF